MMRLARREPDAAKRRSLYRTFFLVVPSLAVLHGVCFALDPILFPRLRRTEVKAPVFSIGHARSGTTLLHRLMAADDERFSYFLLWEMFFPSLLEKKLLRTFLRFDARVLRGRVRSRIQSWDERKFRATQGMHESGLFAAEEDDFVLALSCSSGQRRVLSFLYSTPAYARTLELHGHHDLAARLRETIRRESWDELGDLITDDLLDALVVSGRFDEVGEKIVHTWHAVADGVVLGPQADAERDGELAALVAELQAA
jgi:hypothetical protein